MVDDLAFRPAVELLELLERREVSSRELLDLFLDRIERLDGPINSIVTLDVERARLRAGRADDARVHAESWGPLHGLPLTVKDVFETEGLRTTAGATDLAQHVPARDAVLVARLRRAGAVLFGKTNTPAMASDGQTFNELFGTTNNPWNLALTPGGSSGGCGAAVAAGLTPVSFGSDVAGSIRIPASFCGIYGHKPSWGLIPQRGHIPGPPGALGERDINVVGPLARDARDLDLALSVLAGPEAQEGLDWQAPLPPAPGRALRELRVAAWLDDPSVPTDSSVTERLMAAVDDLRAAGVSVDPAARPNLDFAEAFGLFRELLTARQNAETSYGEWLRWDQRRQEIRAAWAAFFARYDVLLCPVCTTPPFAHDHGPRTDRHYVIDGEERPLTDYTAWAGLIGMAYLPSTSTPLGPNRHGLPIGVQVVGPYLADRRTIQVAHQMATVIGGYDRPPGY